MGRAKRALLAREKQDALLEFVMFMPCLSLKVSRRLWADDDLLFGLALI